MEQEFQISWLNICKEILKKSNSILYMNIIDSLLFDRSSMQDSTLLVYTNRRGQAVFKDVSKCKPDKLLDSFLSREQNSVYSIKSESNEKIFQENSKLKQFFSTNRWKITSVHQLKTANYSLKRQVLSHEITLKNNRFYDRISCKESLNKSFFTCEQTSYKIKLTSNYMLRFLSNYLSIRSICFNYSLEEHTQNPWLLGISKCTLISPLSISYIFDKSPLKLVYKRKTLFKKLAKPKKERPPEKREDFHIVLNDADLIDSQILEEYSQMKDNSINRPLTTNNLAFSQVSFKATSDFPKMQCFASKNIGIVRRASMVFHSKKYSKGSLN